MTAKDTMSALSATKKTYSVQSGWITYRKVGSRTEGEYSDSPSTQEFGTYEEAKTAFDATDIERQWRTEKMCAGKAWDGRTAYKAIEVYEVDEDGYPEYKETVAHETYCGDEDAAEA